MDETNSKALSQFRRVNDLYKHVQDTQKNVALFHLGHWVKLKVGGVPFIVRRRTLNWYPGSVFSSIAIYDKNTTKRLTEFIANPFLLNSRLLESTTNDDPHIAITPASTDSECTMGYNALPIIQQQQQQQIHGGSYTTTTPGKEIATIPTKPSFKFEKDPDGYYLIDRDSQLFAIILNYLRSGEVGTLPSTVDINMLLLDAQFYRLYDLETKLSKRILSTRREDERIFVLNSELNEMETPPFFIIDIKWVRSWKMFIEEEGPIPEPINNTHLLKHDGSLRDGLVHKVDYICVTKPTWLMITKHYPKSGPIISRPTKNIYDTPTQCSIWDIK
ncbi:hypothetical protein SAMD00019534_024940 [Acytostelium subglobosum LB1]|uniref:hypothetical protein n=1 Tax=Acytostelium subglobosum LB1 TaxID=1410327 RepID=UPI000644AE60|nr:hypothetical protein SAMD00019534_024940 [Acytostelium subglobosum LB1]GAM19319.1 hypothetical protein SAMD00019534_024940 [Acytostelium subglobosum LB1]|eukprot:XP_012757246.1 hypothetical protein SAMD00019534_024940 [Acytostelium subglobosum LB1]